MSDVSKIKVAVDLTPLRPGGENGGAKTLILTLLKEFASLQRKDFDYLLITEEWNHEELRNYESSNISCLLRTDIYDASSLDTQSDQPKASLARTKFVLPRLKAKVKGLFKTLLYVAKPFIKMLLSSSPDFYSSLKQRLKLLSHELPSGALEVLMLPPLLQEQYEINLLFCPFSAPTFAEKGLPLVAIAYDLQHLDLPFFFNDDERFHRTQFFKQLLVKANKVICISEFTRRSLLKHFQGDSDQLLSIPICIHERLKSLSSELVESTLVQLGLQQKPYLLYPANFWPHKNHPMLLAAYSIYRKKYVDNGVDLVFTGALDAPQADLKDMVRRLGYNNNIHFLGFLTEAELIAVWQGCYGLIFPSLYEGFGIPVLEAMWFQKPVACSSVGSLPEVGGDAVIYFDPRKPEEIAQSIEQIAHNQDLRHQLVERGKQQVSQFNQQAMAEQYLEVFKKATAAADSST